MTKPKKDIKVHIDGKKTDVNVTRAGGKTTIEVDSDKLDVLLEKSESGLNISVNDSTGILSKLLTMLGKLRRKR